MDFARFRPSSTALKALGGLALAALVAGGCAAPKNSEKSQSSTLTGAVLDQNGAPVPGATVQISRVTAGNQFFGNTISGGFATTTTDASGRFAIGGVPLTPANPSQVILQASKPGFISGLATQRSGVTVNRVIVVNAAQVGGIVAQITPAAAELAVGSTGTAVPIQAGDGITVSVPAGVLTQSRTIAVASVSGTQFVAAAQAPPSTVPSAVGGTSAPVTFTPNGAVTLPATIPLAALTIQTTDGQGALSLVNTANGGLVLNAPIPQLNAVPQVTTIPVFALVNATRSREPVTPGATWVLVGFASKDPATGNWKLNATLPSGADYATTYAFVLPTSWSFGNLAADSSRQTTDFPPLVDRPNGYTSTGAIFNQLSLNASGDVLSFLEQGLTIVTGQAATGPLTVVVPPGTQIGQRAVPQQLPINSVTIMNGDGTPIPALTFSGKWLFWSVNIQVFEAPQTIPTHLQGHVQGEGIG